MEDLLDKIVELRGTAGADVVEFLVASSRRLNAICSARPVDDEDAALDGKYHAAMASLSIAPPPPKPQSEQPAELAIRQTAVRDTIKSTTTPIVPGVARPARRAYQTVE